MTEEAKEWFRTAEDWAAEHHDTEDAHGNPICVCPDLRGEGRSTGRSPSPHEFTEDVADASMCICGIPAYPHHPIHSGEGDRDV